MKPDRKKEKMVFYNTVPSPSAHSRNNSRSCVSVSLVSSATSLASAEQEKPLSNSVPPLPTSYGSSPSVSVEKVKDLASGSGSSTEEERKGRRRPGRKSRQVADSSTFSVESGKCDGDVCLGELSHHFSKSSMSSNHLPSTSPSPSFMPNPSFKVKPLHHIYTSVPNNSTGSVESSKVDSVSLDLSWTKSFQSGDRSNRSFCVSVSSVSNTLTVGDAGQIANAKTHPVGVPKMRGKDSRVGKPLAGSYTERSGYREIDPNQSAKKYWRMSASLRTSSSTENFQAQYNSVNSGLSIDKPGSSLFSGSNSEGGLLQNPHSWPGSTALDLPSRQGHVPLGKVSTSTSNGHCSSRCGHFAEHLSAEDAVEAIEAGRAFRGVLRVNPHCRTEAYVTLEGVPMDILIDGLSAQNRAMEGDVVVVQLNSFSVWPRLKSSSKQQNSNTSFDDSVIKLTAQAGHQPTIEGSGVAVGCGASVSVSRSLTTIEGDDWNRSSHSGLKDIDTLSTWTGGFTTLQKYNASRAVKASESKYNPQVSTSDLCMSRKQVQLQKWQGLSRSDSVLGSENSTVEGAQLSPFLTSVAAMVASMPNKRPTGKVVAILVKSTRREAVIGFLAVQWSCTARSSIVGSEGSLQKPGSKSSSRSSTTMSFVPVDCRFPKMIIYGCSIPEHLIKRQKEGDPTLSSELVVARVEEWKANSALPRASVRQSLGPGGTIEAQTAAILFENAVHAADFPESCLTCLPKVPWTVPEREAKKRRDLRGLRVFTIDPPTAKDLDDALSVELLGDGMLRIGVHIADVSFFVEPNTVLDKEARSRSTSVYLIQRVLPMLPPLLCEELCSLNPGVDRLAFSVTWTVDSSGIIRDQWIGRTIIRSCAKLTYGHAQEMIDDNFDVSYCGNAGHEPSGVEGSAPLLHGEHSWSDVVEDVKTLHEIAKRRRECRFDGGALKLENSKMVFFLDDDGEPYDSMMYHHQDSNFLVEEFMLMANMTVARVISGAFPERALLRRHPEPSSRKLKEFEDFCTKNGFQLDTSSSGALHISLENMRESFQDDPVLFNILMLYATKPMQLAKYFCTGELKGKEDDWGHYALAVPLYTHFTSPIRRYPDLVVHRTLAAALEAERALAKNGFPFDEAEFEHNREAPSLRCFTGTKVDKDKIESKIVQEALGTAAKRHKIPESAELALVAAHCNERRMACRNVREASDKLYLWCMLKKKKGVLSAARVLALGPKFMSLYVCKIAMERRIYYDEIEGLSTEWFEATGTLVLSLSSDKVVYKKPGPAKGKPQRTVADVALLVNPVDAASSTSEQETLDDLIREVENRLTGKIIEKDDCSPGEKDDNGNELVVEPAVLPLTLRWFSKVPVSIHAVGGKNRPLDIAVRLYVSSYATRTSFSDPHGSLFDVALSSFASLPL
ncbi:hypothetical protein R1flu_008284 [Riccia fluitans]|uniref:DIS3-like exonuclease 2 n=1 Tax=Riccia fluitans TaxID=41844 RepID=A0ABD1YC93_9MARC